MTLVVRCVVPGEPVAKERPRSRVMGGKVVTYTPTATKDAEERIRNYLVEALARSDWRSDGDPYTCFRVDAAFYLTRPGSKDADNLLKLVMDAINHCGGRVWRDDKQATETGTAVYQDAANPRTEFTVTLLTQRLPEPKRPRPRLPLQPHQAPAARRTRRVA